MYSRARKKNFSKGIEGVDDMDDSLDSDMTDIEINLDEFGVEGGVEIEYGEGNLEVAAVEEHTTAQKQFDDLMKSQQEAKKKQRKHILTSDTANALRQADTSWAVNELVER